ncbi:MAG: thymidine kinase [Bacilli bacterium]|nr:thymidine kinase [Bacilli bacterium]
MAKLYFRYGAMNSGKTAILLQVAYNYEERGMKTLILKPGIDTKGANYLVSRIGLKRKVDHVILENEDVYKYLEKNVKGIACILVDEAQFLTKSQVEDLMQVVVDFDVPIICYGLRTDFRTEGFEGATRLLEIAHSIEEMKTICKCGRKAIFNTRKVNGKFTFSGGQVAIDGEDSVTYESLCPICYHEKLKKFKKLQDSLTK